ncbi:hypothetical protein KOI35_18520 [Actinoplanes bogorensis]|uniref:Uncharacterized protein n=1 Tax=Paractinoplanes bogorensis TaxID=1610840 RepID=A0ABS5YQA0_9ACTN|nr:hypothetical protein [Actinoplanes bogorensis]MBU2665506.1 hypothetical protein [Actinoplanes bogorensis]
MSDHHDFGDHHEDFPIFDDPHAGHDDFGHLDQPQYDEHHDLYDTPEIPEHVEHAEAPVELPEEVLHEHAAAADVVTEDPLDVFPPTVDVGDLPEPVDGFPWIDTGSLGVVHAGIDDQTPLPVRPEELAEYAGVDLPDAQDPWAALADSEDPATSTLARWWQQN